MSRPTMPARSYGFLLSEDGGRGYNQLGLFAGDNHYEEMLEHIMRILVQNPGAQVQELPAPNRSRKPGFRISGAPGTAQADLRWEFPAYDS